MCGIAGEISDARPVDPGAFAGMVEALAARGPDGAGVRMLREGRAALGHRRLAIIDLSEQAAQPMANETGTVWIVANGEIYNYRELAKELAEAGHVFRSQCDSEVALHAYEEWGDACVERLDGIFAFAVYDAYRDRLLLVRDRLGVKPLYYWDAGRRFVFASQPRAILQHPDFRARVDPEALQHYLAYRYVPSPLSIYAGVRKLPAGHLLVRERGRVRVERWWRARYRPEIRDPREAACAVRERIAAAVRRQLVSDVPVGVFLSGGIDSSAVAAAATAASPAPLPAFTLGFEDAESDERAYARLTAGHLHLRAHEAVLSDEAIAARTGAMAELYDEPFFDDSGIATFAVSDLARRGGVRVILSGDGGDELFAGYRWYERALRDPLRAPWRRAWRWLRGRGEDEAAAYFRHMGYLGAAAQTRLLGRAPERDPVDPLRALLRPDLPPITRLQLLDLETFLVDDVLLKVDHASMACGVEVRVPLLDHALVETVFSIDAGVLYAGGERKALLKRAVAPWLPPEVLTGRKQGFGVQVARRLGPELPGRAVVWLAEGSLVSRGLLSADGVRDTLGGAGLARTWLLLSAELWARRWLENERPSLAELLP